MKLFYIYYVIIFFLISIIYFSNNPNVRCSIGGTKFFDDILGLEIAHSKCLAYPKYKSFKTKFNEPAFEIFNDLDNEHRGRYQNVELKNEVKCPENSDVIIVLGQSNSANHLTNDENIKTKHLNFFNGRCYELTDPVLGASGKMHSFIPTLASKILTKEKLIFVTNAMSSSSITEWSNSNSDFSKYANNNILQLAKKNNLKYVIWNQGESDAYSNINYKEHFLLFKKNLLKNLDDNQIKNLNFIVTQTSICGRDQSYRDHVLNNYQKKLGKIDNIFVTEITDNLNLNYRYDKCHFNKFGIELITEEISQIINRLNAL